MVSHIFVTTHLSDLSPSADSQCDQSRNLILET